jgi:hypothetical protein
MRNTPDAVQNTMSKGMARCDPGIIGTCPQTWSWGDETIEVGPKWCWRRARVDTDGQIALLLGEKG